MAGGDRAHPASQDRAGAPSGLSPQAVSSEAAHPLRVELGWPARQLSPNGRFHHMEVYRFKKASKDTAYWVTKAELGRNTFTADGDITVTIIAHPIKGKVAPDDDNLKASLKAHLDGIALALGVNDKRFRLQAIEWAEPVPHGRIIIAIGGGAHG